MSPPSTHPELTGFRSLCLVSALVYLLVKSIFVYQARPDTYIGTIDLVYGLIASCGLYWLGLYEQLPHMLPRGVGQFLFMGHFWTHWDVQVLASVINEARYLPMYRFDAGNVVDSVPHGNQLHVRLLDRVRDRRRAVSRPSSSDSISRTSPQSTSPPALENALSVYASGISFPMKPAMTTTDPTRWTFIPRYSLSAQEEPCRGRKSHFLASSGPDGLSSSRTVNLSTAPALGSLVSSGSDTWSSSNDHDSDESVRQPNRRPGLRRRLAGNDEIPCSVVFRADFSFMNVVPTLLKQLSQNTNPQIFSGRSPAIYPSRSKLTIISPFLPWYKRILEAEGYVTVEQVLKALSDDLLKEVTRVQLDMFSYHRARLVAAACQARSIRWGHIDFIRGIDCIAAAVATDTRCTIEAFKDGVLVLSGGKEPPNVFPLAKSPRFCGKPPGLASADEATTLCDVQFKEGVFA